MGSGSTRGPGKAWWIGLLLAAGLGALFTASMLDATGGRLSLPLDDAFIFFQYARAVVEGHPFAYQPGDPPTTGATSLLTVLVQAAGYGIGFRGEAMMVFALLLGAGCLAWSVSSAYTLGRRLCPGAAWAPPALLLASGPVLWGVFSGMDLPLYLALSLAWAARWPAPGSSPGRGFFVVGFLLGLARPEALFLILAGFLLAAGTRRDVRWVFPLAGAVLPYVLQWGLTGEPQSASMDVKSTLGRPGHGISEWLVDGAAYVAFFFRDVLQGGGTGALARVAANDRSAAALYLAPLALPLVVLGLVPGAWIEARRRAPGLHLVLFAWIGVTVLAQAFTVPVDLHWNRYLLGVLPLVLVGVAAGLDRAGSALGRLWPELRPGDGGRALVVFTVLLSLPGLVFFVLAYGRNAADIRFQHIEMARELNRRPDVTPDTVVGVHDTGALAYFGTYRTLDLEGLAADEFRKASRLGGAGVWERLERWTRTPLPAYLVLHDAWFGREFSAPHTRVAAKPLFRPSIVAGNPLVLYRADWSLLGSGADPALDLPPGARRVGEVDVGDVVSEAAADYRMTWVDGAFSPRLAGLRAGGRLAVDGGRLVSGGERFTVSGLDPERPLWLVARSHGPFRVSVAVDGGPLRPWAAEPAGDDAWVESRLDLPAPGRDRVTFRVASGDPHHAAYGSFHYWIFQPGS